MKANELRIGNYVDVPNKSQSPFKVDYFDESKVYQKNGAYKLPGFSTEIPFHPLTWDLEDCQGIPLTPEILEKCGFEIRDQGVCITAITKDFLFELIWLKDSVTNEVKGYPFYRNGSHVLKYLHQVQNLVHALTGEEITLNL